MRRFSRALAGAFASLVLAAPSAAEEGMWTFDNFPAARMREAMSWAPDQAWLARALAGSARLAGCSAASVSGEGLVLTNHHCVIACVQALSSAAADYLETGFLARARKQERQCPGLSVSVFIDAADVTARIDAAAGEAAPEDFARARDAEIARIEQECVSGPIRCEVVTLYSGGRYARYRYRRYDDVRLAFAPEHAMAGFGGEADNFSFPRYCADFAFLRLYENGAPARTPAHLRMRFAPLEAGEIVFAVGNPGPTARFRTEAELAFERDVALPWRIALLAAQRARFLAYAAHGAEQARAVESALQSVENAGKALEGRRAALADPAGFAHISAREADERARVNRNLAAARAVGDAWGEIARAEVAYRGFYARHQLLEARAGERSQLFAWARDIVRAGAEREKPDAERMPRYAELRLDALERMLAAPRDIDASAEALNLSIWLGELNAQLGADDTAVREMFAAAPSAEALAASLAQSRLADPAYRLALWRGGAAGVAASEDPLIRFVRAWDVHARAVRARYVAEVETPLALAQERIAQARFRAFGERLYPDASVSPRISYGRVEGWREAEAEIGAFTNIAGLYARARGEAPFALSPRWISAEPRLDADTHFNLVTSTDAVAGNSGGPLLDREGRLVGAVFDGNAHSLGGEYFYDGARNRTISVAAPLIREALLTVYGMPALVAELEGRTP